MQIYLCNGTAAQEWKIYDDKTIRVQGLCLDGQSGVTTALTSAVINTCSSATSQKWQLGATGAVVNQASGACLEDKNSLTANLTPVWLNTCNDTAAQSWIAPQVPSQTALYEPPNGKTYIGVAVNLANLPAFNSATGVTTQPAIYNSFTGKDGDFQYQFTRLKSYPNITPSITWNVTFTKNSVTNGSRDAYIKAAAESAKAYGKPVFVRLNWEMNGFWSSNYDRTGGVTPAQYVASWRYIYNIFKATAPNVAFVWAPNGGMPKSDELGIPKLPLSNWYPGDSYADWIGFSAYPEYSSPASNVLTKPEGLNYIAEYAASHGKPLMLAEWARGTLTQPFSADTSVPVDLIFGWANSYPNTVKALVYFDNIDGRDHVLETHPIAAAAYRSYTVGNPKYLYNIVQ